MNSLNCVVTFSGFSGKTSYGLATPVSMCNIVGNDIFDLVLNTVYQDKRGLTHRPTVTKWKSAGVINKAFQTLI